MLADGVKQSDILVLAGDIDGRACDISYVQLSLLGYAAVVQHMDALAQKRYSPDRFTPGYFLHCMPMRRLVKRTNVAEAKPVAAEERPKVEVKETPKAVNVRALAQAEFDFGT